MADDEAKDTREGEGRNEEKEAKSAKSKKGGKDAGGAAKVEGEIVETLQQLSARASRFSFLCPVGARVAVVLGLFIVVLARGCDAVGRRAAAAAQAREAVAQSEFDDRWTARTDAVQQDINAIQERINALQAIAQPTDDQKKELENRQKALEDARKKLADVQKQRDAERRDLQAGRWRDYRIAARDADRRQQLKGVGREKWFVFGTLVLVFGLLGVAMHATGAERWVALVILSIVILSFYNAVIALGRMI